MINYSARQVIREVAKGRRQRPAEGPASTSVVVAKCAQMGTAYPAPKGCATIGRIDADGSREVRLAEFSQSDLRYIRRRHSRSRQAPRGSSRPTRPGVSLRWRSVAARRHEQTAGRSTPPFETGRLWRCSRHTNIMPRAGSLRHPHDERQIRGCGSQVSHIKCCLARRPFRRLSQIL